MRTKSVHTGDNETFVYPKYYSDEKYFIHTKTDCYKCVKPSDNP